MIPYDNNIYSDIYKRRQWWLRDGQQAAAAAAALGHDFYTHTHNIIKFIILYSLYGVKSPVNTAVIYVR